MRIRPIFATLCATAAGVLALGAWAATFEPHGGVDLSPYLFPVSTAVLGAAYGGSSVPVPVFYGSALLQWVLLGALVDVARKAAGSTSEPTGSV
jgi:hypothetical protein